ncbi:penicillin-binding protein 2 [Metabacillus sp. FJAT-53654]|uniref:serine-type D-Ala-D-Ala carboxypeptidase n=1 Tax=Metabacillus rhizosphaerae TaxID=3117747 RepID=A0ABZ2MRA0_9BACI
MTEQGANASEHRKLKKSRYVRINVFFFLVFLLFVALIVRLGVVQIVQGEEFSKEVARTESDYASLPAPRGKMYDRYNRVVVDNESVPAITYTVDKTTKAEDKIETAKKLAEYINYETEFLDEELKDRDIKDYWLASHPEESKNLLSKKELELKPSETYKLQVDRVPEGEVAAIKGNNKEKELAYIYTRFSSGYQYEPQVVKSLNLTDKEVSLVAEHLEVLPGVDVITDWGRSYPYESLQTIFGGISSPEQGILQSREDYYTARGYARNERVGTSYLEYQYEDYLNPQKAKVEYVSDKSGSIVSEEVVEEGQRGYDLKLSFDMELQMKVEEIVEDELRKASSSHFLMDRAFVVMMDPYQGDVLAMVGKQLNDKNRSGEMLDFAYGAFATQYEAGSTVKGATVLAGYQFGMPIGKTYYDTPLYFKGNPKPIGSYKPLGLMSDLSALKLSSNVYMFYVAMLIADVTYVKHGPIDVSAADFQRLRNYFAQFGLGVHTGIDLPQESSGLQSVPDTAGKLLNIAIGQFDTYTPLQLAQYVSVIANGGSRVQPRIVTSIHAPVEEAELGPIVVDKVPKVLNKVNNTKEEIERVQQGFKLVVTSGTASRYIDYDVAGKTGTSQTNYYGPKRQYWGKETNNLNFVGYYPSENPQVAFSVVVPWASNDSDAVNKHIANRIVKAYIDLQKKYVTTTEIDMEESTKEED